MSKDIQDRIKKLVREDIRSLDAYHVPDSQGMVKLDAMENPYDFPASILDAWKAELSSININRYPDPKAQKLSESLKGFLSLKDGYEVLLGNGSDEIIQMLIACFATDNSSVMSPEPSFVMYKMIAQFCKVGYLGVPLRENFELDLEVFLRKVEEEQPQIIFIAQPNNPTGKLFEHNHLIDIIESSEGIVVIDEAYTAFTDYDATELMYLYDNVLIMRTFSKVGMAGVRLGYLVGRSEWLNEIDKLRLPYNINVLSQTLCNIAIENYDVLKKQAEEIVRLRAEMLDQLKRIDGIHAVESETNFIVIRLDRDKVRVTAKLLSDKLKERKILVKVLSGSHPLLENCLRLTVGLHEENAGLIQALKLSIR